MKTLNPDDNSSIDCMMFVKARPARPAQQARAAARALAHAVLSAVAAQPPLHLNCAPRVQAMLLICAAAGARDDRGGCNYDGASALPQLDATRGVVTMLPQLSRSSVWPPQALKAATQCSRR